VPTVPRSSERPLAGKELAPYRKRAFLEATLDGPARWANALLFMQWLYEHGKLGPPRYLQEGAYNPVVEEHLSNAAERS